MSDTIGTAYVQIEPSTKGISQAISDALNKDASTAGKSAGGILSNALGGAAKIGVTAIAGATTALGAFGASAVKAGASFDSSMSQVAATMGYSVTELNTVGSEAQQTFQKLSDFAQQMGSTTAFSASQAADALNYMALAGYDADTSIEVLPSVLNLAAAGGIELASASDMVTDALSALGKDSDYASTMVDQMAMASSKSNTSVSQLGEAMLTIGGTAKGLAGGTAELSTALGLLADNGIKGAEGGTHLRNILLSLQPSTEDAAMAWESLGVSAYDANGEMRPLVDVFGELNTAMEGMTSEEKNKLLSNMFNKTDLSAVNALLSTTTDRWNELNGAIDNSKDAASNMAAVQLDNLEGDITLFKSALEGAQIAISTGLTPSLREFVQFGANGLSEITDAFNKNGLSGAMEVAGQLIGKLLDKIVAMLPDMIDAGMQLLTAIMDGILQNLPTIVTSAVQIITSLTSGLIQMIPQLIVAAGQIIQSLIIGITEAIPLLVAQGAELLNNLAQGMSANMPTIIANALTMIQNLVTTLAENAPILIEAAINFFMGLAQGLADSLPTLIEMLPQIITDLANIINDNMPTILMAGFEILVTLGKGIISAIPTLIENIPQIFEAVVAVWMALDWISLGKNAINFLKDGILAMKNAVSSAGKNILDTVVNVLKNLPNTLLNLGKSAFEFFKNGIISLKGAIEGAGKNIFDIVINALKNLPSNLSALAKDAFSKFVNAIIDMKSNITTAVKDIFDIVVNGLKELPSKMLDIGKNLITGLWNGISDKVGWITDKIAGFGESVISSIKDIFGIASPSRVMRDEVGKWIPAGISVGIEANADSVYDSMNDLKDNVLSIGSVGFGDYAFSGTNANEPTSYNQTINITTTDNSPDEIARRIRIESRYGLMLGGALG